jgi:ubiquinone/menaquinone biosynthesis C-methylase UbiE
MKSNKNNQLSLYTKLLRYFFGNNYKTKTAKYVSELCDDKSYILDLGCNDGRMASYIISNNPSLKIEGVDIQDNLDCQIKRTKYDGKNIPFPDNYFDIVIAIDMLHHTNDISSIIKEMSRVSKKYIIIKDVAVYSIFSHIFISIADYLSNFNYGIKCTYNFPKIDDWNKFFYENNLKIVEQPKKIYFGYGLNERYNPIFKLIKL